jgi:hypothetical protein
MCEAGATLDIQKQGGKVTAGKSEMHALTGYRPVQFVYSLTTDFVVSEQYLLEIG